MDEHWLISDLLATLNDVSVTQLLKMYAFVFYDVDREKRATDITQNKCPISAIVSQIAPMGID